jgi:hypothetical protein
VAGGFSSTYDGRSIGFGVLFALPLLVGGLILNTPIAPLSIAVGIFPFGWFFLESLYDSKRPILKWVGKHTRTMSDQLAKWSSYTCDSLVLNVLVVSGALPWRFRRFLNFSDDALLLKRAGNDYEFVHRLLREHFALRDYLPLMHADDEATRLELVKSLAILGDDAAEPLRHISQHDPSEAVRQAASDAQFT